MQVSAGVTPFVRQLATAAQRATAAATAQTATVLQGAADHPQWKPSLTAYLHQH
jgi:hypothetical protein